MTEFTPPNLDPIKAPKPSSGSKLTWLLLILLALLGAGGAISWHYWQQIQAPTDTLLNQHSQQLQQMAQQLQALQLQLQTRISTETQQAKQLTQLEQKLTQLDIQQQDKWLALEAQALVKLALQRLALVQDPAAARRLLQAADNILSQAHDAKLLAVRKVLNQQILALQQAEQVDVNSLFLQLGALHEAVAQFHPVLDQPAPIVDEPAVAMKPAPEGWWNKIKYQFELLLKKLTSLVSIKHHQKAIDPLLSAEQAQLVKQNTLLLIEQAQLALLQGRNEAWQYSLKQAKQWFVQYSGAQPNPALLQQFDQLQAINIQQRLPNIQAANTAISDYLKSQLDTEV